MFTGIIEEVGKVKQISSMAGATLLLTVEASQVTREAKVGDSIAVNGCCLTIVAIGEGEWSAEVVQETLSRTSLGALQPGHPVNLEAAMRLNQRLGGHLVQGHIDGTAIISAKTILQDKSIWVTITPSPPFLRYIVEKGSIAIDGVSLTVAAVNEKNFSFAMIPHTASATNLGWKSAGAIVNIEIDLIAKYVEKLSALRSKEEDVPWIA
jgi:riboflavin synthase